MNIKWEVLKLQVHCILLTGGCLKIKFFIMKAVFQSFFLFLLLSEIVLGQEQVHGFFKFIGFFNEPQVSSMINKIHNKSRHECSSECLKYENCYIFDFCKTGSSISCYFYNNNNDNNSDLENGMCRRYELVSTDLLYYFITFASFLIKDWTIYMITILMALQITRPKKYFSLVTIYLALICRCWDLNQ